MVTAVSAPGKVLLAGGYLVLDRAYTGVVFGLDARIHVLVDEIATTAGVALNEIAVVSPQFSHALWQYGYRLTERDGGVRVTQLRADADLPLHRNPFIETTLSYVLSYITTVTDVSITPASLTILADNSYYSTPATTDASTDVPRFHDFQVPLDQAHKTGLGSSAALVTAVSAALLSHYLPASSFDLTSAPSRRRLHNIAQAAHCAAQGKVGSGFDVASAVYGSCVYRRFSPELLTALNATESGARDFATQLAALVDEHGITWDHETRRDDVQVAAGLRLVMCDVAGGSQTPGMVKQVLAWRRDRPDEAARVWTELDAANQALASEMRAVATKKSDAQPLALDSLATSFARIRAAIRSMTALTGVPIEPASQTALLDACERVPGVVGGVVPGAGGYDAVALLIRDQPETVRALEQLFASWDFAAHEDGVAPVGEGHRRVSILAVREDMEGVRKEKPEEYGAWLKAK